MNTDVSAFQAMFEGMTDEQLLDVAACRKNLPEEAAPAFVSEMRKRRSRQPANGAFSALAGLLHIGLVAFAVYAGFKIWSAARWTGVDMVAGLVLVQLIVGFVLGALSYRCIPSRIALWCWIVPGVVLLIVLADNVIQFGLDAWDVFFGFLAPLVFLPPFFGAGGYAAGAAFIKYAGRNGARAKSRMKSGV